MTTTNQTNHVPLAASYRITAPVVTQSMVSRDLAAAYRFAAEIEHFAASDLQDATEALAEAKKAYKIAVANTKRIARHHRAQLGRELVFKPNNKKKK